MLKRAAPFIFVIFLGFGWALLANAAEVLVIDSNQGQSGQCSEFTPCGQSFSTSTSFSLSKISLFKTNPYWCAPEIVGYLTIYLITNAPSGSGNTPGGSVLASSTVATSTSVAWMDFIFDNIPIESDTTYSFTMPSGSSYCFPIAGTNYGSFTAGDGYTSGYPTYEWEIPAPPFDLTFKIYGLAPSDFIDILKPADSSTIIEDPTYWEINYGFSDGGIIGGAPPPYVGQVIIQYGQSSSSLNFQNSQNVWAWQNAGAVISKPYPLIFGQWYAAAFLYDASSTLRATSTIISFEYSSPSAPTSTLPTATSSCVSGNFFTNGLCKMLQWLFIPSSDSLERFSNFTTTTQDGTTIRYKPPFGYFAALASTLQNTTSTASSSFQMVDMSFASSTIIGPLKTGTTWLLWFLFGFWGLHRFKHIEL